MYCVLALVYWSVDMCCGLSSSFGAMLADLPSLLMLQDNRVIDALETKEGKVHQAIS